MAGRGRWSIGQGDALRDEAPRQIGQKRILVQSDSQLFVKQLNGEYRVKDKKFKLLFRRALTLLRQLDVYRIVHVRREMNKLADWLVNQRIGNAAKHSTRARVD